MAEPPCDQTEDHEKYMGEVMLDPWEDPDQTDWPNNPTNTEEVKDGNSVGRDQRDAPLP